MVREELGDNVFCQNCGSKLKDGARFCTVCGSPVSAPVATNAALTGSPAVAPTGSPVAVPGSPSAAASPQTSPYVPEPNPYMPASGQAPTNLGDQISHARRKSRKRVPMVLIVVLVVLGLATVAAAAVYVYNTYFREEPQAEVQQEVETNPHDVYNQVLDDFKASEDNNWAQDGRSELTDLYGVQRLAGGHIPSSNADSPTLNDLELGTVSYAYYDLGQDGTDDLLISVIRNNGECKLLAVYTTDGADAVSLTDGGIADGAVWRVVSGGQLTCFRILDDESTVRSENVLYTVSDGKLQVEDSYWTALFGSTGIDRSFSYGYHGPVGDADNSERLTSNTINDKFDSLPNATIDWQSLSDWSH